MGTIMTTEVVTTPQVVASTEAVTTPQVVTTSDGATARNYATGYESDRYETNTDKCSSDPCQNNGTCVDSVNGYTCTCVSSYRGFNCERTCNLYQNLTALKRSHLQSFHGECIKPDVQPNEEMQMHGCRGNECMSECVKVCTEHITCVAASYDFNDGICRIYDCIDRDDGMVATVCPTGKTWVLFRH